MNRKNLYVPARGGSRATVTPVSIRRMHRAPGLSRQRGFSIIEVMMSVMLLAIGAALALPSYREMVEKRQLTHGAEQILAFVNTAQGEATKQNEILTVSYSRTADDNWCVGATLGATACTCTQVNAAAVDYCAIDAVPWIINNTHVGNTDLVKSMTGDGAYSFDPIRGIFVDTADTFAVEMRSDDETYHLNLQISNTGQAVLCSDNSGHSVPGYQVCPADAVDEEAVPEAS